MLILLFINKLIEVLVKYISSPVKKSVKLVTITKDQTNPGLKKRK